jgi:hypothetical protein
MTLRSSLQIQSVIYVAVMKSLARPLRGSRREVQVCSLISETTAVNAKDMSVALMVRRKGGGGKGGLFVFLLYQARVFMSDKSF